MKNKDVGQVMYTLRKKHEVLKCHIYQCDNPTNDYLILCVPQPGGGAVDLMTDQRICKYHQQSQNVPANKYVTGVGWDFIVSLLKGKGYVVPPFSAVTIRFTEYGAGPDSKRHGYE